MSKIQCYYEDCRYLRDGECIAEIVELSPEDGCLTYLVLDAPPQIVKWSDDDTIEVDDSWDDVGYEEKEESDYWDEDH